jgi:hypothetical protein
LVGAAVVASSLAVAPPASAAENCVGAEGVAVVCVDPTGRVIYSTCVYTGGTTCEPVVVPGPDVTRCDVGSSGSILRLLIQLVCEPL